MRWFSINIFLWKIESARSAFTPGFQMNFSQETLPIKPAWEFQIKAHKKITVGR